MRILAYLAMAISVLSYILYVCGGVALTGAFFYGLYALFFKSVALGLMLIGGAVVGGWVLQFGFGILMMLSTSIASKAISNE